MIDVPYIRKSALCFSLENRLIHILYHTQKLLIYKEAILQIKANLAIKIVRILVSVCFQQLIPLNLFLRLLFLILGRQKIHIP